jgi:hypothetical protein
MVSREATIQKEERTRQLKQGSTGSARGTGEAPSKKKYRRADIMALMRDDPERYMALQPEIMLAYQEKRVI